MPSANDQDEKLDIPLHPRLELVGVCVQPFSKWSRRLLVYRKRRKGEGDTEVEVEVGKKYEGKKRGKGNGDGSEGDRKERVGKSADELNEFRRRYFQGFKIEGKSR